MWQVVQRFDDRCEVHLKESRATCDAIVGVAADFETNYGHPVSPGEPNKSYEALRRLQATAPRAMSEPIVKAVSAFVESGGREDNETLRKTSQTIGDAKNELAQVCSKLKLERCPIGKLGEMAAK